MFYSHKPILESLFIFTLFFIWVVVPKLLLQKPDPA